MTIILIKHTQSNPGQAVGSRNTGHRGDQSDTIGAELIRVERTSGGGTPTWPPACLSPTNVVESIVRDEVPGRELGVLARPDCAQGR